MGIAALEYRMKEMFAAITDTAGNHLAYASVNVERDGTFALTPVVRSSLENLFTYYFHRGGRRVAVDLWEVTLEGMLRTRMNGTRRQWWIAPQPARVEEAPITSIKPHGDLLTILGGDELCCLPGEPCGEELRTGTTG
jgi:hypothetical protein